MVGRRSLIALARVSVVVGGRPVRRVRGDDDGIPFEQLVQVYVPDQDAVDSVVDDYDAAEYKRVEDDGSIMLNVFVTAEEKAALKATGYRIGRRHRGLQHRSLSA